MDDCACIKRPDCSLMLARRNWSDVRLKLRRPLDLAKIVNSGGKENQQSRQVCRIYCRYDHCWQGAAQGLTPARDVSAPTGAKSFLFRMKLGLLKNGGTSMAIRRKRRLPGSESGSHPVPPKSETVQQNMERLRSIVNAASASIAAAGRAATVPALGAHDNPQLYGAGVGEMPDTGSQSPDSSQMVNVQQVMNQADEGLRAAMQQAQSAIQRAEAILIDREASMDERVAEAQRIAEQAVAAAIGQSDTALHSAMNAAPEVTPQAPAAASPDSPTPGDPGGEVQ
jgi:hypothetical protein